MSPKGKWMRPSRPAIVPIGPSIAYIVLTRGMYARVSRERAEELGSYKWQARWSSCTGSFYARRSAATGESPRDIYMARQILGLGVGDSTGDHIDRDTLNNCDWNLRRASRVQQCINQGLRDDNMSGVKGISWKKDKFKWAVQIQRFGLNKHIGYYDIFRDAVEARIAAENEVAA